MDSQMGLKQFLYIGNGILDVLQRKLVLQVQAALGWGLGTWCWYLR